MKEKMELGRIPKAGRIHQNLSVPELIEFALKREEGKLTSAGALACYTGSRTGRSPRDRFFVSGGRSQEEIDWGGVNQAVSPEVFEQLVGRTHDYLAGRQLFVVDGVLGADPEHAIPLRVISELAWHALFSRLLFRRPEPGPFRPSFTVLSAPGFKAVPERDGTSSEVFVGLDLNEGRVLITGTAYAGEIKKSMFTSGNFLMPFRGVFPMHCSANVGRDGKVALFFGLSGTGKTTLSADPDRRLIGDDEHGWSEKGVFNFEGGCYAKCINLSKEKEPQIYSAIRFGSVLENVVVDEPTRDPVFSDASVTENTRAAYPLDMIPGYVPEGRAGHPQAIIFLTADAFGVMPPVAKLSPEQAMYHFLSGFTSKLAGTEAGLGSEPEATFSTCFGAPFLPLSPSVYADMLGERIRSFGTSVFLVNTGWTGGPYGIGRRMDLPVTRAIVKACVEGRLDSVPTRRDEIFNLDVPLTCPGVESRVLDPRSSWKDPEAYEIQARELAHMFARNFERFQGHVPAEVTKAGPAAG